jgi:cell division protein FtsB
MAQTPKIPPMNLDTLIPIIIAFIAALPGLLALNGQKTRADAASTYQKIATDAATENERLKKVVDVLEIRVDDLERRFAEEVEYNRQLDAYVDELVTVMRAAGLQPLRPKPVRKVMV